MTKKFDLLEDNTYIDFIACKNKRAIKLRLKKLKNSKGGRYEF